MSHGGQTREENTHQTYVWADTVQTQVGVCGVRVNGVARAALSQTVGESGLAEWREALGTQVQPSTWGADSWSGGDAFAVLDVLRNAVNGSWRTTISIALKDKGIKINLGNESQPPWQQGSKYTECVPDTPSSACCRLWPEKGSGERTVAIPWSLLLLLLWCVMHSFWKLCHSWFQMGWLWSERSGRRLHRGKVGGRLGYVRRDESAKKKTHWNFPHIMSRELVYTACRR